ncbi:MAG: hypothetical protein RQ751_13525, partial [Longimicrobiales bacterium]|nr:hypothetical protein [Longimicrobiales bacterium]
SPSGGTMNVWLLEAAAVAYLLATGLHLVYLVNLKEGPKLWAARATWAVASMHLRAQDRVGLLARGRTAAWLPPRSGRRARLMLLDELLSVGRAAQDLTRRRIPRKRVKVPHDALIVGVTSLQNNTFSPNLLRYRRHGHATVALVIDTADLLTRAEDPVDAAARRLWFAQRHTERRNLRAPDMRSHGSDAGASRMRRRSVPG